MVGSGGNFGAATNSGDVLPKVADVSDPSAFSLLGARLAFFSEPESDELSSLLSDDESDSGNGIRAAASASDSESDSDSDPDSEDEELEFEPDWLSATACDVF